MPHSPTRLIAGTCLSIIALAAAARFVAAPERVAQTREVPAATPLSSGSGNDSSATTRPIVAQPVRPAPPKVDEPPVVPQSISPVDVEQVKPADQVELKQPSPNKKAQINTRDGLAAEQ